MANGIEEFNWAANVARVGTGFKGNPFFNDPAPVPMHDIGGDFPAEVLGKLHSMDIAEPTPSDPWVIRRFNATEGL